MNPHLDAARAEIDRSVGGLNPGLIAQPRGGRWSIGEILEHLVLSYRGNTRALEKAIASGTIRGRRPTVYQLLGRTLVMDIGYFPRAEAPEPTKPTGSIPAAASVRTIREALGELDAALTRAEARFGSSARVGNHPYFAGLTVPQWRKFHWRHTVHHMRQVRQLLTGEGEKKERQE